jgi:hypothetical protein
LYNFTATQLLNIHSSILITYIFHNDSFNFTYSEIINETRSRLNASQKINEI